MCSLTVEVQTFCWSCSDRGSCTFDLFQDREVLRVSSLAAFFRRYSIGLRGRSGPPGGYCRRQEVFKGRFGVPLNGIKYLSELETPFPTSSSALRLAWSLC